MHIGWGWYDECYEACRILQEFAADCGLWPSPTAILRQIWMCASCPSYSHSIIMRHFFHHREERERGCVDRHKMRALRCFACDVQQQPERLPTTAAFLLPPCTTETHTSCIPPPALHQLSSAFFLETCVRAPRERDARVVPHHYFHTLLAHNDPLQQSPQKGRCGLWFASCRRDGGVSSPRPASAIGEI